MEAYLVNFLRIVPYQQDGLILILDAKARLWGQGLAQCMHL